VGPRFVGHWDTGNLANGILESKSPTEQGEIGIAVALHAIARLP